MVDYDQITYNLSQSYVPTVCYKNSFTLLLLAMPSLKHLLLALQHGDSGSVARQSLCDEGGQSCYLAGFCPNI
jgi:hypothetical protein